MREEIHEAAQRGDVESLGHELASGVSPNALDSAGWTPLHNLCLRRDVADARVDCLRMLLKAGADIHATTILQTTPRNFAAKFSHAKVVAALLEAGADVNRGDANNATPLHFACARSDFDVEPALLLLRHGAAATVNARDDWGRTPLDVAILQPRRRRLVPILLRAGATPPAQTTNAYIQKVIAAGGFGRYQRNQLNALAATFAPHFAHLPPEIVRLVVKYAFHVGYY